MFQFKSIAKTIISYLSSPVMLVSLFGPMIQHINLVLAEQKINYNSGTQFNNLKELLENLSTHGLLSYNTQIFVLLLAWLLVFTEFGRIVLPKMNKSNISQFVDKMDNSNLTWGLLVVLFFMFILGLIAFLSGFFASPTLIKLYEPANLGVVGNITFPPLESRITICRGVLIIYSVFFTYWQKKNLPILEEHGGVSS